MNNYKLDIIQILVYVCAFIYLGWIVFIIKQAIKQKNCSHKHKMMYVENVAATCERITTTCMDCGKKTTKIEC